MRPVRCHGNISVGVGDWNKSELQPLYQFLRCVRILVTGAKTVRRTAMRYENHIHTHSSQGVCDRGKMEHLHCAYEVELNPQIGSAFLQTLADGTDRRLHMLHEAFRNCSLCVKQHIQART